MKKVDEVFEFYKKLFNENNFNLYMIGSASRDYLLNKEIKDYDLVTNATPDDMKKFIHDGNYIFEKYGCVKTKYNNKNIDITTLRKEQNYNDYRHPGVIIFTNSLKEDSKRRDFTINALYIDENYNVIDFYNGLNDLKNKMLRIIGDPEVRIKEDPLRILRAYRFSIIYDLEIDKSTKDALINNVNLIKNLNKDKIKEELNKIIKTI